MLECALFWFCVRDYVCVCTMLVCVLDYVCVYSILQTGFCLCVVQVRFCDLIGIPRSFLNLRFCVWVYQTSVMDQSELSK